MGSVAYDRTFGEELCPKNKMRGKLSPPSKRRVLGLNSKLSLTPSRVVQHQLTDD